MENTLLNLIPAAYLPEVHISQYDIGRTLTFNLKEGASDYNVPTGATVTVKATKPSGFGFAVPCTFSGGVVTLVVTETMTPEHGRFPAELSIVSGNTVIGTSNFIFNIERSPHPEGTIDGDAETIIPELTLLVERIENAASSVLDMQVVADTLPPGSQATYSYDEELNKATFGIPQGEPGAGAIGTVASAYDASKTYAVGDYAIHNNDLYRCITAITTAETFTASHWTKVVLADDVTDLKSDLIYTQSDIYNKLSIEWERKVGDARGRYTAGNGAKSQLMSNIKTIYLSPSVKITVFLYRNGSYIGKINANYGVDQVSGSWGYYTGIVNIESIMSANNADGVIITVAPTDGTTITDETVQTYGDANVSVNYCVALTESNTTKAVPLTWIKGLLGANGTLYTNDNGVTSDYLSNIDIIKLSPNLSMTLFFYKNGDYIGKISANGTVNTTGADWRKLFTVIKVREIISNLGIDADSFRFGIAPVDGTTITDENAQTWGDANAQIYASQFVTKQYFDSIKDNFKYNPLTFMSINHRGYSTIAPENTLPAYALSKKMGFEIVECDLEWTSDNVPVLLHDSTINRTGRNADGTQISSEININDITYEQALTYDFGIWKGSQYVGTKIPTLAEFVLLCKNLGLKFLLDIKNELSDAQVEIVANAINAVGMGDYAMFGTKYYTTLQKLGAIFPKALLDYGNISVEATDAQITNAIEVCNGLKTSVNKVVVSHYQYALTQAQYDALTDAGINTIVWRSGSDFSKSEILAFNKAVIGAFVNAIDAGKVIFENTMADYE